MEISPMIAMLQAQGAGPSILTGIAPIVLMLVFAYVVLFLPQQRRQKKWQAMLDGLKTGDKVITSGGLRGTVIALKDDALHLRVPPDNLRIEVSKASIVSLASGDEAEKK
jgi:preprotein translocase subunit YajC